MEEPVIKIGKLGINYPELLAYKNPNSVDFFSLYSELLEKDIGNEVKQYLEGKEEIKNFETKLFVHGTAAASYSKDYFARWLLWRINRVGKEPAYIELNNFLEADCVPLVAILWTGSLEVDKTLNLGNGIELAPWYLVPESSFRDLFHNPNSQFNLFQPDSCSYTALIKEFEIKRILYDNAGSSAINPFPQIVFEMQQELNLVALLLPLIHNCRPFKDSYLCSTPDTTPFGIFSCGGSMPFPQFYEKPGFSSYIFTEEDANNIKQLSEQLKKMKSKNQIKLIGCLERFSQAKRRKQNEQQILDLGITLEMLVNRNYDSELSFRMSLETAFFIEKSKNKREKIFKKIRELYGLRSDVVHTGKIKEKKIYKINEKIDEYEMLLESLFKKCIEIDSFPSEKDIFT